MGKFEPPLTITELRSLIGLATSTDIFLPNLFKVASLLIEGLKKTKGFASLSPAELDALEELKNLLKTMPRLALPRKRYRNTVDIDAKDKQLGSDFIQERND